MSWLFQRLGYGRTGVVDIEHPADPPHVTVDNTPLPVTSTPSGSGTQAVTEANLDLNFGTWGYASGVSGTPTIGAGKRVIGISAHSTVGGSFTINGGNTITVPANVSVNINPLGNLVNPTIVFTSTDTFFVEFVS